MTLARLVEILAADPDLAVEVQGHTDSTGDAARNQRLSEQRAQAVRGYLIAHGVEQARLTAMGYGSAQPVAPDDTPPGRQLNRRIAFVAQ